MNTDTRTDDTDYSAKVRALNDAFRHTLTGGSVLMTASIMALGSDLQTRILAAVQSFEGFTTENDPWGEHDFGACEIDGEQVFFKIDYFDPTRTWHSPDPADQKVTHRVLTIMLAEDY